MIAAFQFRLLCGLIVTSLNLISWSDDISYYVFLRLDILFHISFPCAALDIGLSCYNKYSYLALNTSSSSTTSFSWSTTSPLTSRYCLPFTELKTWLCLTHYVHILSFLIESYVQCFHQLSFFSFVLSYAVLLLFVIFFLWLRMWDVNKICTQIYLHSPLLYYLTSILFLSPPIFSFLLYNSLQLLCIK